MYKIDITCPNGELINLQFDEVRWDFARGMTMKYHNGEYAPYDMEPFGGRLSLTAWNGPSFDSAAGQKQVID